MKKLDFNARGAGLRRGPGQDLERGTVALGVDSLAVTEFTASVDLVSADVMPGTPSSVASVLDGYPLAQQGRGREAIGNAIVATVIGTLTSTMALIALAFCWRNSRCASTFRSMPPSRSSRSPLAPLVPLFPGIFLGPIIEGNLRRCWGNSGISRRSSPT